MSGSADQHEPEGAADQPGPPSGTIWSQRARSSTTRLRPAELRERAAEPFRRWSLTWRLVAVLVVVLIVALSLSNIATGVLMRRYLMERAKADLRVAAQPVAMRALTWYPDHDLPSSYSVVLMRPDGQAVLTYPAPAMGTPVIPPLGLDDPRAHSNAPFIVPSRGGGSDWLVLAGPLAGESGTYAVATSLQGIDQTVGRLTFVASGIGLIVVGGCVVIGWLGFRRAFRPLRTIEDTAAAIAAGDLTRRVPEHAANDEVQSLARSLNAMLAHIEGSFLVREASEERMRQFVTDASHELRTPLATIRGYAELYRQGAASSPEATASAFRRIEDEATRMGGLVEDLLTLARLDNQRPFEHGEVDLTVLAGDAVQDARVRAPDRSIRLTGLGEGWLAPTTMVGDEARLRQVLTNLLANALTHTPPGVPIEVRVGEREGRVRVEVCDHGPGLDRDAMRRVFERFYRHDPARGRKPAGGYGLGLAIVAAIVEGHAGRVGVAPTPGGGATFVVDLPRHPH